MALSDAPDELKPYIFHGIDLEYRETSTSAMGDCPFCGDHKFNVVIKEQPGKKFGWRCPKCDKGGNVYIFLREFYQHCLDTMQSEEADENLRDSRRLFNTGTISAWGLIRSSITGEWLVPGYNVEGALCQLYRYVQTQDGLKLLATPTLNHYIHGVNLYDPTKSIVAVCEGPWDAMALWELLAAGKWTPDGKGLLPTGSVESSALADINVVAVPGCNVFHDSWASLLGGKIVWLMYDSDHPKNVCGGCAKTYSVVDHQSCPHCSSVEIKNTLPPAGYGGVQRVALKLKESKTPPDEVKFIRWGENNYADRLPSGTDVRDVLSGKVSL